MFNPWMSSRLKYFRVIFGFVSYRHESPHFIITLLHSTDFLVTRTHYIIIITVNRMINN